MCYNSDVQIFVVFFNTCAKSLIYDSCKWTCACVAMELLNLQPKNYIPLAEQGNSFDSQCKQQQRAGSKEAASSSLEFPLCCIQQLERVEYRAALNAWWTLNNYEQ